MIYLALGGRFGPLTLTLSPIRTDGTNGGEGIDLTSPLPLILCVPSSGGVRKRQETGAERGGSLARGGIIFRNVVVNAAPEASVYRTLAVGVSQLETSQVPNIRVGL